MHELVTAKWIATLFIPNWQYGQTLIITEMGLQVTFLVSVLAMRFQCEFAAFYQVGPTSLINSGMHKAQNAKQAFTWLLLRTKQATFYSV